MSALAYRYRYAIVWMYCWLLLSSILWAMEG